MIKNELILDKVRSLTAHDPATGKLLFRLTSLEDPTLSCTAEGEEVTDAIGSVITTLYRAKKATFSATNSLISLDLAAAQYGTKKQVASDESKIIDYTYEILTIADGKVTLSQTPNAEIKYIYSVIDGEVGTAYEAGSTASKTNFVHSISDGANGKEITVPTGLTGKVFVEYTYETAKAVRVGNSASKFPEVCSVVVYAYFRDKCNENVVYSGKVIGSRAKLNPEQVEIALTSTGKHAFEFQFNKDYCADEGEDELFAIIVSE